MTSARAWDSDALRDRVRQSVATKQPIDDAERACIADFLRRFDALPRPFDEHADPVHVTGSAIVVGARGVLLIRHKSLGIWLQPGGHVEPGESPWDGALREADEETGLAVEFVGESAGGAPQLVHVDVHPGPRGHTHLDLRYLVGAGDRDPQPPEGESQEAAWFDWDAAVAKADDQRLKSLLRALSP
jgi:ADP-ribose pyrophosphatase YjhB (NUDIX family)